ncbi:FtsH protease activity modulator HflK [Microvirga pudoricolor]|uniref:FtsH protease activity modulator HflK n=1 Tax=Microvirga pudoricolor TaxID=2778729 RepID=UPI00194F95D2|nr:FtsH protease activity modulator HflK [Microvirga pudoricolor]MBM6594543.1 FtsH protease activity modulator HflK [Microvirga pudoricolor]
MPWSNQSGGGGGPWGQRGGSGGGKSPWGSGPQNNGTPPDLEDILRRGQDRLKGIIPGGSMGGGKGIALLALAVLAVWLLTGFYTVRPNEVGINMVFGKYTGTSGEGLRYNWPYPIGRVQKPNVTEQQRIEVGYRSSPNGQTRSRDVIEESLMLTGDENIVDIDFDLVWQVNPARAQDYVFNLQNPTGTIKSVAESAMREVVGRRQIQAILTTDQASVAQEVRQIAQDALDAYGAGVLVNVVQLQAVQPPADVRQAFFDVNAAQQDAVRVQNEAETFASQVVPQARGEAARAVQQAEGYREQSVADATGQAARFSKVYDEYQKAPAIIRERIFLETMERVFGGMEKVIIDQNGQGQGVVPYLPLNEMQRRQGAANQGAANQAATNQGAAR